MKNVLLQLAMKLNKERKRRKSWHKVASVLAAAVVFCTTYALILPAITMDSDAACGLEAHQHSEACYTEQAVSELQCGQAEAAGHTHEDGCYAEDALVCEVPETAGHTHSDACYIQTSVLALTCGKDEHVHEDACYPVEGELEQHTSHYLCAMGEHIHSETCQTSEHTMECNIVEHIHEAACLVADLDLTAVETAESWEAELSELTLTGVWSADVVTVAESQLGYQESGKNCVLVEDELKGYTRYGDWYGDSYGDWDAMFAAYCLHYAGVKDVSLEADSQLWIEALTEAGLYAAANTYDPKPGDLIFFGTAEQGAERVGIVKQLVPATEITPAQLITIEGNCDDAVAEVTYECSDLSILGYGCLPESPLSAVEWAQAKEVAGLIEQLPGADEVTAAFESLNQSGDKAGFEALRQELTARMAEIVSRYESFNALQKELVGSLDRLAALQETCGGIAWQELPAVSDDSAVVSSLTSSGVEIISSSGLTDESDGAPDLRENSISTGDTVRYPITVEIASYYTDIKYSQALVKVELILPLSEEQAVFDTSAMTWLEESSLTIETRTINDTDTLCQVLTGYKRLQADGDSAIAVPGSFTETISVTVKDMAHGERLTVIVSAAMEHSAWEGVCPTHAVEEKRTIVTEQVVLYHPLSAEEQQAVYEAYIGEMDALSTAEGEPDLQELEQRIYESYCAGALSDDHYGTLYQYLLQLSGVDLESIAEPSVGNGWIWMDFETEMTYTYRTNRSVMLLSSATLDSIPATEAMPAELYSELGLDSSSQIHNAGGENSADDVIWVSKTIEGTEQENVFDITLQIITKDTINEVYKEPDMAVVIVMDISNTMTSVFSGETTVTRYDAAMDSAYQFMKSFAEETDGLSKLGYVAFNTHGHEVFPMQACSSLAQANALNTTMRSKTKSIMDTAAAAAGGKYGSSHDRFTNIEAGLAMAADMLDGVDNQHKYIIFLSDGFPTTYMTASTTDGYKGYDPYTSNGTNKTNGVFYDAVMNHHCDYGTSYSDTAAIKAREMAVSLKAEGINIFSIGVDVEGQTIYDYHWDSVLRLKTASTVERREEASYYNTYGYEIGTLHSELTAVKPTQVITGGDYAAAYLTQAQLTDMSNDFKDWLKGTKTTGIGSDFYYDSTDEADLAEAYTQIFQKILEMNAASSHLDWVATDPMPDMGVHELETVEFIGFWDYYDVLQAGPLIGESKDNSLYYNTASFDTTTSTINWDLKNSGYQSVSLGTNKNYMSALKYRIRLQNENTGFVERQIYDTNDTTFLYYRVIEVVNNVTKVSDRKYIEFPIPEVFGYLAELKFQKVDPTGDPLVGAKFTLTHDTANCGTCRGDGEGYVTLPVYEAVSDSGGMVTFTNIPSGHHYILTETEAPEGFIKTDNTYQVVVSYDTLTVTVTDADGNPLEWTATVENDMYYALPNTGGTGTRTYILGALLIMSAALMMYTCNIGRRERREAGEYS